PSLRYESVTSPLNRGNPRLDSGNPPIRSAGRSRDQSALAALRAHVVFPHEPAGTRDARRRTVPRRGIDADRARHTALAVVASLVSQEERRDLLSGDHHVNGRDGCTTEFTSGPPPVRPSRDRGGAMPD